MIERIPLLLAASVAIVAPGLGTAEAAPITVASFSKLYGTDPGHASPAEGGQPFDGYYRVNEGGPFQGFLDRFDFSSIGSAAVGSLDLTVEFSNAGLKLDERGRVVEDWGVVAYGSRDGATFDDFAADFGARDGTLTWTLDATTDIGGVDAFATAIAAQELSFGFDEFTTQDKSFKIYSARLDVRAPAVVPLPAAGWLLLAALGGLGAVGWRRRRARA
jgi:hypothetical protein